MADLPDDETLHKKTSAQEGGFGRRVPTSKRLHPAALSGMVMYEAGGCSPGPIYRPHIKFASTGPNGRGPEYTIPARTFHVTIQEKKTQQDRAPGPKYSKPQSVGPQVESVYPSQQIVKFGTAERVTLAANPSSTGDVGCGPVVCMGGCGAEAGLWRQVRACGCRRGSVGLAAGLCRWVRCMAARAARPIVLWRPASPSNEMPIVLCRSAPTGMGRGVGRAPHGP